MTIVYLHPVGLDGECWSLTGLVGEMPTMLGHGDRPTPPPHEHTLDHFADDIAASFTGLLDIVGVSMGSRVAQHLALRHPDRVRSLMLCCGRAPSGPGELQQQDQRAEQTMKLGMEGMMESTLERWFTKEALGTQDHPGVAYARRRLAADNVQSVAATWRMMGRSAIREELPSIEVPVTILGGRYDQSANVESVVELFGLLPTSRLEIINGPHMLMLERPAEFAGAVERHIGWVSRLT